MRGAAFATLLALSASPALGCGVETDCEVPGGTYRMDLPDAEVTGAILFAHGYGGSAAGTIRNEGLRAMATDRGLAFVALDAGEDDWALPNAPHGSADTDGQSEFDYVAAVVADVTARTGVAPDAMMLSGFSAGGMLVWNVLCATPDVVGGFVAVSGTFWDGPPETCATPVGSVIHIHGDADTVVPREGRPIGDTRQGNIFRSLDLYRAIGGFGATRTVTDGALTCEEASNADGAVLDFCSFEGGHSFSRTYLSHAWDRFVAAGVVTPG